jgi:hypothetical protein
LNPEEQSTSDRSNIEVDQKFDPVRSDGRGHPPSRFACWRPGASLVAVLARAQVARFSHPASIA